MNVKLQSRTYRRNRTDALLPGALEQGEEKRREIRSECRARLGGEPHHKSVPLPLIVGPGSEPNVTL